MSISSTIVEAAQAAARPARAVSDAAAVTAGVEAALAADRRCWGHRLVARLDELPASATGGRELVAAFAEEFFRAADEIDHGAGETPVVGSWRVIISRTEVEDRPIVDHGR